MEPDYEKMVLHISELNTLYSHKMEKKAAIAKEVGELIAIHARAKKQLSTEVMELDIQESFLALVADYVNFFERAIKKFDNITDIQKDLLIVALWNELQCELDLDFSALENILSRLESLDRNSIEVYDKRIRIIVQCCCWKRKTASK